MGTAGCSSSCAPCNAVVSSCRRYRLRIGSVYCRYALYNKHPVVLYIIICNGSTKLYTSFYLTPRVRCKEYDMFPEDLPIPYLVEDEMTFKYQSIEELGKQCHKLIVTQLNSYTGGTLIMAPRSNVYTGSREDINRLHAKTSGNSIVSGFFIKTIDLAFVSIQSCASATAETMLHEMIHRYTSDEGLCSYLTYCIAGHLHQDVQLMALWSIVSHSDYDVYGTARKYFTPKQVSELRSWCAETMSKYKVGIQEGD